jgi:hypothetical protein
VYAAQPCVSKVFERFSSSWSDAEPVAVGVGAECVVGARLWHDDAWFAFLCLARFAPLIISIEFVQM